MVKVDRFLQKTIIVLVKTYQWLISPFLGDCCRFFPSCSQYMIIALERHGILRGGYLGCKRLLRCHPWCEGGVDKVPES